MYTLIMFSANNTIEISFNFVVNKVERHMVLSSTGLINLFSLIYHNDKLTFKPDHTAEPA